MGDDGRAGGDGASVAAAPTPPTSPVPAPRNGGVSFWQWSLGPPPPRPALPGPTTADVCIIGAGYTGLWTAWALSELRPSWRVVVLEGRHAGYGASGRNGGWLSGLLPGNRDVLARRGGRPGVVNLQRALFDAVDEVLDVVGCSSELFSDAGSAPASASVSVDACKGGTLAVATTPAGMARLRAQAAADQGWGVGPADQWLLGAGEVAARVGVAGALGGLYSPHCARIHPAKLVRRLADLVVGRGVELYERTPALGLSSGRGVDTPAGRVAARWVVRATEGFTAGLPGQRRELLPMNSSMIVTAPALPEGTWGGAETVRTAAHAYLYAQRTADGRIALGGRGVPYRWGSATDRDGRVDAPTVASLTAALRSLWPDVDAPVEHAWCGVLGVARDWCPSVVADPETGVAAAGGYVGDGVTTSYLAGRTLADLITGTTSARTRLPWVGHHSREWEPEPLRWLGARAIYALYRAADRAEPASGRPRSSPLAALADRLSGRA